MPAIEVQAEIYALIARQRSVIDGAKILLRNWSVTLPQQLEKYKKVPLSAFCKVRRGASPRPVGDPRYFGGNDCYWLKIGDVPKDSKYTISAREYVTEAGKNKSVFLRNGDLILTNSGATLGYPSILKIDACIHDGFLWFENLSAQMDKEFLYYVFKANRDHLFALAQTGTQPNLNTELVGAFRIPVPPIGMQRAVVEEMDKRMAALEGVRMLIADAEVIIDSAATDVWGDET